MTDLGGDPACWADRVCPACGMLDERAGGVRDGRCPHCGRTDEAPDAGSADGRVHPDPVQTPDDLVRPDRPDRPAPADRRGGDPAPAPDSPGAR